MAGGGGGRVHGTPSSLVLASITPALCYFSFFLHFVKAASSRVNPSEQEECFVTLTGLHFLFPDVDIIQEGSLKL